MICAVHPVCRITIYLVRNAQGCHHRCRSTGRDPTHRSEASVVYKRRSLPRKASTGRHTSRRFRASPKNERPYSGRFVSKKSDVLLVNRRQIDYIVQTMDGHLNAAISRELQREMDLLWKSR